MLLADQTKDIYRYAKGTGVWNKTTEMADSVKAVVKDGIGDIFSWMSKPLALAKKVISSHVSFGGATGMALDMGKGLVGKATTQMGEFIKSQFEGLTGGFGGEGFAGGLGSSIMGQPGFKGFRKTSPFGYRRHPIYGTGRLHAGVDLAAPTGTNVYAQNAGRVTFSGRAGGYGNLVKIAFGNMENRYAHLSQAIARTGSIVARGQLIGKVGSTGASTGPHLHFEKRINGRAVHPGYAKGTKNARKGWAWVGEEGPELMNFKGGEQVISNRESLGILEQAKRFMGNREDIVTSSGSSFNSTDYHQSRSSEGNKDIDYDKLAEAFVDALEGAEITANTYLDNELVSDKISNKIAMKTLRRG